MAYDEGLAERISDVLTGRRGKPMSGYVAPAGLASDRDLATWIDLAAALPAKPAKKARRKA